jgi:hypothetical protein
MGTEAMAVKVIKVPTLPVGEWLLHINKCYGALILYDSYGTPLRPFHFRSGYVTAVSILNHLDPARTQERF